MSRMTPEYEEFLVKQHIRADVDLLKKAELNDELIVRLIMEKYGLSEDKAKTFLN